ncbi:MAG: BamA/TamA family outer membrane protein [Gemmatimonadetes bacterium]|nr:BamA/TamA family outer membrane protein [Gemmatimonadota bacterium]
MRLPLLAVAGALVLLGWLPSDASRREVDLRDLDGRNVEVKRIRFVHPQEKPFGNPFLRTAMRTRSGEPFRRRYFRDDLAKLENLYRGIGYLDVDIARKEYLLDEKGRLHIRLWIESGRRWKIEEAGLALDGAHGDLEGDLLRTLRSHAGGFFEYKTVIEDERALVALLNNRGYSQARARNRTELDSQGKLARVTYEITPGRRMYFGEIRIRERTGGKPLQTRSRLVRGLLTFRKGQLFNPHQLRLSRNNLSRTDLFRSVTLSTPAVAPGDSLQPIEISLQERKFINLEALGFFNNTEPGAETRLEHANWLGRGTRIGLRGYLGRPKQGAEFDITERNVFDSGADLTMTASLTDEWGRSEVFADPEDSTQFALLTSNDSILDGLLLLTGPADVAEYIQSSEYDYPSIERLLQFKSSLSKQWEPADAARYHARTELNWDQSRTEPVRKGEIDYSPGGDPDADPGFSETGEDTPDDEDPFGDEDPFAEDAPAHDSESEACGPGDLDYACGSIPIDHTWLRLLTEDSNTLNLTFAFNRDSRDNPISPSRGTLLHARGRYAVQFGRQPTRVLDGEVVWRYYLRLHPNFVWAQQFRGLLTASLRKNRDLPQAYWIKLGGEGSVRGVGRERIQVTGGGRAGANVRSELRINAGDFGFVVFWDRAGVWRHLRQARWTRMVDGYGFGLRYERGIPFRFDVGWSRNLDNRRNNRSLYFSIGQAF